jgi:hypothetical protein
MNAQSQQLHLNLFDTRFLPDSFPAPVEPDGLQPGVETGEIAQ